MKKLVTSLLVVAAIGISAGTYYNYRRAGRPPEVTTAAITRGSVVDSVGATGTLEAVTTVQVGTQVSGTVKELFADFNSIVRRGQVIARLDPSLFETQIDQAKANLVRAEADLERLRVSLADARTKLVRAEDLSKRSLIPQSELETAQVNVRTIEAQIRSAEAQVTQARASLNQAEVNLAHTVIAAPIDGIVISRNVDVGQTVAASMQAPVLFLLAADLTKMKVNASIDEADVGRIRPGQRVNFRVDAYPADDFEGLVSQVRLQPVVVQNVVTYACVIDVPNPNLRLKPGMTANVTIEVARADNVLRVPNAALRFRPTDDMFLALNLPVPETPGDRRPANAPVGQAARGEGRSEQAGAPGDTAAPSRQGGFGQGGGQMDPERRRQMQERFQNMSPEERERFAQRMREGGPGAGRPANRVDQSQPALSMTGAQTIDSLFGPLPRRQSVGQVWLWVNGQLKLQRVRLGIADSVWTELLSDELPADTSVVTGILLEGTTRTTTGGTTATQNPLMPQPRGGFPRR